MATKDLLEKNLYRQKRKCVQKKAKDANIIPGINPNKAPINRHNNPARGKAKTETKK